MPVKNVCNCDSPPGGGGACEPHQLAVCRSRQGQCHTECVDPPAHVTTAKALLAWVYEVVAREPPPKVIPMSFLTERRYFNATLRETVTFKPPQIFDRKNDPGRFSGGGSGPEPSPRSLSPAGQALELPEEPASEEPEVKQTTY